MLRNVFNPTKMLTTRVQTFDRVGFRGCKFDENGCPVINVDSLGPARCPKSRLMPISPSGVQEPSNYLDKDQIINRKCGLRVGKNRFFKLLLSFKNRVAEE